MSAKTLFSTGAVLGLLCFAMPALQVLAAEPAASATSRVERQGRTFYFCSEHCKEVFLKENN